MRKRARNAFWGRFGPKPEPDKWVFVVGCYNSGTTLLHDLIATHPQVGSLPTEGHFLTDQLLEPQAIGLPRLWAMQPETFRMTETSGGVDVERMLRQWGAQFDDYRRPVLIEKTPINAARLRWLQQVFPNAYFVGIIRNGYAVAEGITRKVGHPLDQAARQWAVSNQIMLEDFEAIEHKCLIRYEDLAGAPARVLGTVLDFLGLERLDDSALDGQWRIHESQAEIQNMNARSLAALSGEERLIIEREAGTLLMTLGYSEKA